MRFSVIIPAHNAASTLVDTLDSVTAQTFEQFEVIVVDDASTDGSSKIAEDYALRDPRISVQRIRRGGTGVARNEGLRLARNEWILFLDADDIISPVYLERVGAEFASNPELGAVYVDWEYFNAAGKSWQLPTPALNPSDLFPTLARYCPFIIHSCIVSTALAREIGGFDPALVHAEDWDFWQRIARTNTKFKHVPEVLASYRVGQMSESTKTTRALKYNARVLERGHRADARIKNPISRYASGMPKSRVPSALLSLVAWMAGLVIGQQLDFRPLLKYVKPLDISDIDPEAVAWSLFLAVARSKGLPTQEWSTFQSTVMPELQKFLHRLEKKSGAPGLSLRVGRLLEDLIIDTRTTSEAATVGRTCVVPVPIDQEILDVVPGADIERIRCLLQYQNKNVGEFMLPVCDGRVPASIISDTIAANSSWKILALFFQSHIYPECSQFSSSNGIDIWRDGVFLGSTAKTPASHFWDLAHESIGWTVFLQEFWGQKDWGLNQFYDAVSPADDSAPVPLDAASSEPCFDICRRLSDLQTGSPHIDALVVAAGIPLGRIRIPAKAGVIRAGAIRATINDEIGKELVRMVVRNVIIGRSFGEPPDAIRARLIRLGEARQKQQEVVVARGADTGHPSWYVGGNDQSLAKQRTTVVGRRNPRTISGSDMQRVRLPIAAEESVIKAAIASGRPCLCTNIDKTGARTLISAPELIVPGRQTPDENMLPDTVDSPVTENSAITTLPILAYPHRSSKLPDGSLRDPVTPEQFESNMRRLQELGYRTVSLSELSAAMAYGRPLTGKVVIITIDELDDELLSQSWATLRRFDFTATLFAGTEHIHPTSRLKSLIFRRRLSARAKLLGRLCREGLEIGSLTASARPLTWLSHCEVVSEAARSFATLIEDGYASMPAIAYPMGQCDPIVEHLVSGCGYSFGLTVEARPCRFADRPMALPRFQITADTSEGLFEDYLESVSRQ
jgi:GT2 family glycosyltransferase/peptidoglycan/xylan/chitin deacetylase (PgdA/CDA1 family)